MTQHTKKDILALDPLQLTFRLMRVLQPLILVAIVCYVVGTATSSSITFPTLVKDNVTLSNENMVVVFPDPLPNFVIHPPGDSYASTQFQEFSMASTFPPAFSRLLLTPK